ncbi:MAG: MoaD/ThiS family protein [Crocinitomicaceae bacterium]|nr:MoaD/ThiS family protein [Crocinitomicaceae bacterium]
MKITVLFFGMLAEQTKTSKVEVETNVVSVGDFEKAILEEYPALKDKTYSLAFNENLVARDAKIDAAGTLAFLPPFAGG